MKTYRTKSELQAAIREQITSNDSAAVRALLRIFQYQTSDEQAFGVTSHNNGVGFTGSDAEILTSFVNQYNQRRFLSDNQLRFLKRAIGKYAGQLLTQAIGRGLYKKQNGVWMAIAA